MRISELLEPDLVLPDVTTSNKQEAIEILAAELARHYPELDRDRLIVALRERERLMSTALAEGVALPHARMRGGSRMVAAFARSRRGIDWGAHDEQPTHLILAVVVPEASPGTHLKVLASASRLLHDAHCRARLLEAPDAEALLEVIRDEEDARSSASAPPVAAVALAR
jgi:mannitol/fructose-specific phosphotransferase system IIA component (Ntr-type)